MGAYMSVGMLWVCVCACTHAHSLLERSLRVDGYTLDLGW